MNEKTHKDIKREQEIILNTLDKEYLLRYIAGELCAIRRILTDMVQQDEKSRLDKCGR